MFIDEVIFAAIMGGVFLCGCAVGALITYWGRT
jgi:hypothetical protein